MSWRLSYDDALKPVDSPISNNGPYAIRQGAMAALAVHEASHAVMMVCTGGRVESIEVALNFERGYGGVVVALVSGVARKGGETGHSKSPAGVPLPKSPAGEPTRRPPDRLIFCWRAFLKPALVTAAGPIGAMKYLAQGGLSRSHVGESDARYLEWCRRVLWTTAGRPGDAFVRLVWREACRLMDEPLIWKAVQAVEAELFSGLLWLGPADPRPGDRVEFVMPGGRAEELIAGAGIALPNIIDVHRCGPECIRPSRKTSRRWDAYLAQWAAEEPKNAA
jgi:Peptidase M50B-like